MSYPVGSAEPDGPAEFYGEARDRQPRPRFRGAGVAGGALLVIGVFAGGLWLAYVQGTRHAPGAAAEVPLIRADTRPIKVRPEKPGGMEVPDRDKLIYTQKRAAVEHLLPPPEKPLPRPTAPPGPAAALPPAAPPVPETTASAPPAAPPIPEIAVMPAKAPPKTTAAAPAPAAKPAGRRIQLASVRSEEAARQEWDRIRRANSDLLGSLSATMIRADLAEKGVFYRVQTGPVADAERLCHELKQRNIGCLIAR